MTPTPSLFAEPSRPIAIMVVVTEYIGSAPLPHIHVGTEFTNRVEYRADLTGCRTVPQVTDHIDSIPIYLHTCPPAPLRKTIRHVSLSVEIRPSPSSSQQHLHSMLSLEEAPCTVQQEQNPASGFLKATLYEVE